MVSTPQRSTSCMNGYLTQALHDRVIMNDHHRLVLADQRDRLDQTSGRLKRLLSQLPGRFCPPRSMEPSASIMPGQPMPMNGASLILPSWRLRSVFAVCRQAASTASSRLGFVFVAMTPKLDLETSAFDRSPPS